MNKDIESSEVRTCQTLFASEVKKFNHFKAFSHTEHTDSLGKEYCMCRPLYISIDYSDFRLITRLYEGRTAKSY